MATQDGHCKSTTSLSQCEVFCKQCNLPLHFSLKKKHCCCRNDIESSEPGYVVIWEEGESFYLKLLRTNTQPKMKFFITDFLSKYDHVHLEWRTWSYLRNKPLMENFIFCAVKLSFKTYLQVWGLLAFALAYYFNHLRPGSSSVILLQELLAISLAAPYNSSKPFWRHHRDVLNIYWSIAIWHK